MAKIALIGPSFFGYLENIAAHLNARGLQAEFFDERPSNSALRKLYFRFAPRNLTDKTVRSQSQNIANQILEKNFTHVLFISSEVFTSDQAARLKEAGLKLVRYAFDSNRNKAGMQGLDPYVSRIASFDPDDCLKHGYDYIPLYAETVDIDRTYKRGVDVMYCGTVHSHRPAILSDLLKTTRDQEQSTHLMLYFQSRFLWTLRYGWNPAYWPLLRILKSTPFPKAQIVDSQQKAHVILDIHHPMQSGLTMRFFEALACGAVVLTTNPTALKGLPEEISNRVVILRLRSLKNDLSKALSQPTGDLSPEALEYLSIGRFLDQIEELLGLGSPRANRRIVSF